MIKIINGRNDVIFERGGGDVWNPIYRWKIRCFGQKKAEPYPEDDSIWDQIDGEYDMDRAFATFAKMALEGRL